VLELEHLDALAVGPGLSRSADALALLARALRSTTPLALVAGVYLHGAAADALVTRGNGPIGLAAGELTDAARALINRR
jgi:NAD(P)H-hydrate repair Nnr-like enzyme with NAD(P)H-hydrate dehydratase domain